MKKYFTLLIAFFLFIFSGCTTQVEPYSDQIKISNEKTLSGEVYSDSINADTRNVDVKEISEEENIVRYLSTRNEKATLITRGDVNLNGKTDFLVEAIGVGCGSCHSRPVYLFEDERIAFEYYGDDYSVIQSENNTIKLREPIRLDSEPMCCPSAFQITTINCPKIDSKAYCLVSSQFPEKKEPTVSTQLNKNLSNDNYYTNVDGDEVHSPAYADSKPSEASALCKDGTYSFSQNRRGTCSGHGGVSEWY